MREVIVKRGKVFCLRMLVLLMLVLLPCQAEAAKLKINKTKVTLYVGQESTIKATPASASMKWSTNNKKVVSIKPKGNKVTIVAKGEGKAKVTCKVGKKSKSCTVYVKVPKVKLSQSSLTMTVGDKKTIKVTTDFPNPKWSISDTGVATIKKTGKKVVITAKKAGAVVLTCSAGNVKKTCKINVKAKTTYIGRYTSDTGELSIRKSNGYKADISITRLCYIENLKCTEKSGKLEFTGKDPSGKTIKGTINKSGKKVTVKITKTTWTYFKNGQKFVFYEGVSAVKRRIVSGANGTL